MDKITVVCHKDHDKGYEDYVGKCLLCEVERLQNRDWVGLTPAEFNSIKDTATTIGYAITKTETMLKQKNNV